MTKPTIAEYLVGNEELLAQLYKLYAQKYSSHADFWGRLSDDEKAHAKKISEIVKDDSFTLIKKKFNEKELENFKNAVEIEIEKFNNKTLDIKQALNAALRLERTLIISKFFETSEKDPEELKLRLIDISESVDKHKERIEKMISKL
jgi:hypothetical protein